jgi:tyrosyl-tRNA synthetase
MPSGAELIADLTARGLRQDCTDVGALTERLDDAPVGLYCGFDPTAASLHIGNLQSIMLLRRFQLAGHAPIALVGGATGMIGDPSGRTSERQFLDVEVLDHNRESIGAQLRRFLDFDAGPASARLVDNRSWTEDMSVLEFLRDVGKYATVNTMLARDSVRSRMDRESGISYTEFSYMLLQAHDFLVLHRELGCDLQVAGSDQWGNITAGIDLVRRRTGDAVHGWTAPLIVRADGTKFGKSEGENVWLSSELTSPYRMYQYLLNIADDDVATLLLRLTTVPVDEVAAVVEAHSAEPSRRGGQRRVAQEVTSLVHGAEVMDQVERASAVLFGQPLEQLDAAAFDMLAAEIPTVRISRSELLGMAPVDLFAATPLAKSKGEVRRTPAGYYLNQSSLADRGDDPIGGADLVHDRFILLRRGRTSHQLVEAS